MVDATSKQRRTCCFRLKGLVRLDRAVRKPVRQRDVRWSKTLRQAARRGAGAEPAARRACHAPARPVAAARRADPEGRRMSALPVGYARVSTHDQGLPPTATKVASRRSAADVEQLRIDVAAARSAANWSATSPLTAARCCARAPTTPTCTIRPPTHAHPSLGTARSRPAPPARSAANSPSGPDRSALSSRCDERRSASGTSMRKGAKRTSGRADPSQSALGDRVGHWSRL